MIPVLDVPVRYWRCPSCQLTDRTQRPGVHTQFHPCPALGNVNIPLVEVGDPDDAPKGRQVVVEPGDYIGDGVGFVGAIRTERTDGSNDVTVFVPTAIVESASHQ